MRRWVKVSLVVAVVLGVGGKVAEPSVRDWVLARNACGGALPRDAVEQLSPEDSHLKAEESQQIDGLGSYSCSLTMEGDEVHDERLVVMQAFTRRDDQDREFMTAVSNEEFSPQAPVPDGLPGFIDKFGTIQLLLPCPDLGKDADGRQRKLLVHTRTGRDANYGVPGAVYRTAVSLANSASKTLGCGAKPLKAPKGEPVPVDPQDSDDRPAPVSLSKARDTGCGWVTRAGLSKSRDWRVTVGTNDAAPMGYCDLSVGREEESGAGGKGMYFVALYGDWSNRLTAGRDKGERRSMTASARCGGEAAHFALAASDDIPGVGETMKRRMLKEFAQDQTRRRGCSGLRLSF
ncbi:hypothetical protein U9R90_08575 [Streptomyces sp. E11-3]|uniref:hypothetical protein n=1 Tax=Streptomyces sp. E11-3 TaxID=3110112 RepID=UPI00397F637A